MQDVFSLINSVIKFTPSDTWRCVKVTRLIIELIPFERTARLDTVIEYCDYMY